MRYCILALLLSSVALANPPSLTQEQHVWLVAWMAQLQLTPQDPDYQPVWDQFEVMLLDGDIVLPDPPVDPNYQPTMSEAGCNMFRDAIIGKGKECNDLKDSQDSCTAEIADPTEAAETCSAEMNAYMTCKTDLGDARMDYNADCDGRHPPDH